MDKTTTGATSGASQTSTPVPRDVVSLEYPADAYAVDPLLVAELVAGDHLLAWLWPGWWSLSAVPRQRWSCGCVVISDPSTRSKSLVVTRLGPRRSRPQLSGLDTDDRSVSFSL